jgi:4-hydroxy-tetrahydrodipicolinate synthase
MNRSKLRGTGVALVTPFSKNGDVDYKGLEKLINHCIKGGVEYVVSLGTTGESVTLSAEEKLDVLNFTIEKTAKRVLVVAGFGGNNTHYLIKHEIDKFHFKGVDAVLSVSPAYNKPTQEGIYQHYKAVAAASPVPVLLYNVPSRTGSNLKAETTLRLAEVENIIGIKEASGDFAQCMQIVKNRPKDFLVISGDDNITLGLMAYGFDGVISVVGQAFPKIFTSMVRHCLTGDFASARKLHYKLNDITDMLFADGNPAGVKAALEIVGVCEKHVRLPLVDISAELRKKLNVAIEGL